MLQKSEGAHQNRISFTKDGSVSEGMWEDISPTIGWYRNPSKTCPSPLSEVPNSSDSKLLAIKVAGFIFRWIPKSSYINQD